MKTKPLTGPEIIERIAAHIDVTKPDILKIARSAALATLDAIREPTPAMIENDDISEITIDTARAIHSSELPCASIWRAMIDALRREIANGH